MKRKHNNKRIFALFICLCMAIMGFSSGFAVFADDEGSSGGGGSVSSGSGSGGSESSSSGGGGSDSGSSGTSSDGGSSGTSSDSGSSDQSSDSTTVSNNENAPSETWGNSSDVEGNYTDLTTQYDLQNEVDVPPEPEETPPPVELIVEEDESAIYGDENFDAENAAQLKNEYVLDELIIKFKSPSQVKGKEKQLQKEIEKVTKLGFVESLGAYVIKVDDLNKNPNAVLNHFKNNKFIDYVEPNYVMKFDFIPNDTNYKSQSLVLSLLKAQDGWDILTGDSSKIIAVVDSGVAVHPDLPPLMPGYSAVSSLSPNNDKVGHGTGVAGTIGCIGNNGIGSAGINWNASIMPVKVDDANGTLTAANVANGIKWAADNGAKVINMSIGFATDSTTIKSAIDYAYNKGCVLVAATGNDSKNAVSYPARYSNVIAVGSTTNGTTRVASSNYGTGINVVAYGGYYTATASNGYSNMSGTSFASPQVAALASMVWGLNPKLTNAEVCKLIEQGCKPLGGGFNQETGYGLIDIANTLKLAGGTASSVDSAADTKAKAESEAAAAAEAKAQADAAAAAKAQADADAAAAAKALADAEAARALAEAEAAAAEAEAALAMEEATNIEASLPPGTMPLVLEAPVGTRNNYSGAVGYDIEALTDMTVTNLGRPLNGTMNATHRAYIWNIDTKTLVGFADITPDSPLDAAGFKVAALDKPVNLQKGGKYRIVSDEFSGGDKWYDITDSSAFKLSSDCRFITSSYGAAGSFGTFPDMTYNPVGIKAHVGVNLYYEYTTEELPPAQLPPETQQDVRTAPIITLSGFTDMTLDYGQTYKESGYSAIDCKNVNLTAAVKITNNVDIWKAGMYTVSYDVSDVTGLSAKVNRTVTVLPEPVVVIPPTAPKITINGSNPIILHLTSGTPYKEQSAKAVDYDGKDISNLVKVTGSVNRNVAGTYTLTYSVTSPDSGLTATTTRNVRIVAPTEKKDPRTKYGLNGQAKQGAKVTHTGIVSPDIGFMDLQVSSIDKNMTIIVELVDTATKKSVVKDTFTAAGTKQYRIDQGKYELAVTIDKANGNSKYEINLLMPETAPVMFFAEDEVPLTFIAPPKVAPIGSNPIILHLGGTPYMEQGARALDFNDMNISDRVEIIGEPDTSVAGTYIINYKVVNDLGLEGYATREVRIIAPNEFGYFDEEEVPLADLPIFNDTPTAVVVNCYMVNVRKMHGAQHPAIAALQAGATVSVLDSKYDWYLISDGVIEGWVYGQYLSL